jgi:endogenous inhibitor of DNA gyrase (YacG/DUF329 family)
MRIPKRYGESKKYECPFCGKTAITENNQGVPVCLAHKNEELMNLKCVCGEYVDLLKGKFGPYFHCMRCGNVNFNRIIEFNERALDNQAAKSKKTEEKKEIKITSRDVDFF